MTAAVPIKTYATVSIISDGFAHSTPTLKGLSLAVWALFGASSAFSHDI
ncbi:MAG TPA: hypothetical protein VMW34_10455 [Anaerolineales bacterium]|nr:hypothetical protein [Anaerolineales bacterium]